MMRLSLVIPCYNESESLPLLIQRCAGTISRNDIEVVFVDNGSTDSTSELIEVLLRPHSNMRSVRVPENQGYGYGILAGLRSCVSPYLAWTHADMQTDPADVVRGLELFESAKNPQRLFVKGRRRGRPFGDVVFTVAMSVFEMLLLRQKFWDINAQPTIFHRDFFLTWRSPPYDFSLDLFAYYMAQKGRLNIKRLPVYFGERAHGQSHWNISWKSKIKFIRRTIAFSLALRRNREG